MIQVNGFRNKNAIRFVNAVSGEGSNFWMVLGKHTSWSSADGEFGMDGVNPPSDANPPIPLTTVTATTLTPSAATPDVAIQATANWVIEDDVNGTIQVRTASGVLKKFTIISSEATAIADAVLLVCASGVIYGNEMPYNNFRVVGFVTDLVPGTGFTSNTVLTPSEVTSWGQLECVEYDEPVTIVGGNNGYTVSQILGF